jgi:hypothetical protein
MYACLYVRHRSPDHLRERDREREREREVRQGTGDREIEQL